MRKLTGRGQAFCQHRALAPGHTHTPRCSVVSKVQHVMEEAEAFTSSPKPFFFVFWEGVCLEKGRQGSLSTMCFQSTTCFHSLSVHFHNQTQQSHFRQEYIPMGLPRLKPPNECYYFSKETSRRVGCQIIANFGKREGVDSSSSLSFRLVFCSWGGLDSTNKP